MTDESGQDPVDLVEPQLDHRVKARTGEERYRTRLEVRGHVFSADEPPQLGGGDLGPTPYDLLCAALASCTTITLRMYADRKGWPVEEIVARVAFERRAAEGTEGAGEPEDVFRVELELAGELTEAQRQRMIEIAGRCPVHKTLARGSAVEVVGA